MNIENQELQQVIAKTIAQQILGALTQEHRDQFLIEAVTKALKDYSVKNAIEKVVAARAEEVAIEMMKTDHWTKHVKSAVQSGFAVYLDMLPKAITETLIRSFHGDDSSSYGRPSLLLEFLRKATKD